MNLSKRLLPPFALALSLATLLPASNAQASNNTCVQDSSQCVQGGCVQETTNSGTKVTVCASGTANPPSGALIDNNVSCWDVRKDYACPDPLSDCISDPTCTKVQQTCTGYGPGGVCASYQQVYDCTKSVKVCMKYKDLNSCTNVNTEGLQNQPAEANTNGFAKAAQSMALLNAIKKNISGANPPTLFAGKEMSCGNQAFCGGVNFQACCCDKSLKKSGGFLGCSTSEVKLAGERRQKLTHHLETCCSDSVPLLGCVAHEQSYCAFDSLLGRIIQEQGRQQLAALAAGGTGTTTSTPVSLSLYGSGGWQGPYNANGNSVWVYQWPNDCNLPASAASSLSTQQTMACPQTPDQLWWAACDGNACSAPSAAPPAMPADSSLYVLSTDGTASKSVALSKYVVTTGSCKGSGNPACSYTLSGLTAGAANFQTEVSWSLYQNAQGWNSATTLGTNYQIAGYSLPVSASPATGGTPPTSVSIEYARASIAETASSWTSMTLPLSIPATSPVTISGTGIRIWGDCSGPDYQCDYHAIEPGTATPKPWDGGCQSNGDPVAPDCSGFTLPQFMLLDLSKMNLGEWLASQQPSVPNVAALQSGAASTASGLAAAASTSPPSSPVPAHYDTSGKGATVLKLSNSSCQIGDPDCTVTADVAANWPDASALPDPVTSVDLNWGDGTSVTLTGTTTVQGVQAFQARHTYTSGGTWTVTAVIHAQDGTHQAQASFQGWIDSPPQNQTQQDTNGGAELIQ